MSLRTAQYRAIPSAPNNSEDNLPAVKRVSRRRRAIAVLLPLLLIAILFHLTSNIHYSPFSDLAGHQSVAGETSLSATTPNDVDGPNPSTTAATDDIGLTGGELEAEDQRKDNATVASPASPHVELLDAHEEGSGAEDEEQVQGLRGGIPLYT